MGVPLYGVLMAVGTVIAAAGLWLLFLHQEPGLDKVKLSTHEYKMSTPARVVFGIGCAVFLSPIFVANRSQQVIILPRRESAPSSTAVAMTNNAEIEPNDEITTSNLIEIGKNINGEIATAEDRDFYKFKTSALQNVNEGKSARLTVIVRKTSAIGFHAMLTIYDQNENKIGRSTSRAGDPVAVDFETKPSSLYYVLVEGSGDRGPYELTVQSD